MLERAFPIFCLPLVSAKKDTQADAAGHLSTCCIETPSSPNGASQVKDVPKWSIRLEDLIDDWRRFDQRVADMTREVEELAKQDENCKGLMAVPGIGPMTASAMVAAIGDGAAFTKGRDFAAWLGLVPKQISTGDRTILGGISRRGNRYLRTLFIQGARSVLQRSDGWEKKSFGRWLIAASKRLHKNVLAVALANKLARIAWTVLYHARGYDAAFTPKAA